MKTNYLFGKKSLQDALNNNLSISHVYLQDNDPSLIGQLKIKRIPYSFEKINFFDRVAKEKKHQGIAFILECSNKLITLNDLIDNLNAKPTAVVLILDSIQDVGNMGAILRSADVFAIDAVIYKKDHQINPFCETIIKTSTNAISYLNLCEVTNLNDTIEKLKKNNFWFYATCFENDSAPYYEQKFPNKTAFIFGNENTGISKLVIKNSDHKIYIPQYGHIQSLNVSVAVGIILSFYRMVKLPGKF